MTTFVNNDKSPGAVVRASDHNTQGSLIAAVINGGIDNNNIASNAGIAGSKLATGGVDTTQLADLAVTTGKINDGAVTTGKLAARSVTPSKLDLDAATAAVATSETETSTSYDDLSTSGPAVTVTIGANALAMVIISCEMTNGSTAETSLMSFVVSGTSSVAASDTNSIRYRGQAAALNSRCSIFYLTASDGLVAGSSTFTSKYRVSGNTGTFQNRHITVIPY